MLAWILLLVGLVLLLGGSGYLVYLSKQAPTTGAAAGRRSSSGLTPTRPATSGVRGRQTSSTTSWKDRLFNLRRSRAAKEKTKARKSIFGAFGGFGKQSREIPHVEKALKQKGPLLDRLHNLAQHHAKVKDRIVPGLRSGEKSIFNKLDNIAQQTKTKKIGEVVSSGEAKNIFDKLKKISQKRKSQ